MRINSQNGRQAVCLWAVTVLLAGVLQAGTSTGIRGTVVSQDGAPVASAVVTAVKQYEGGERPRAAVRGITGQDGGFALEGLTPGAYKLCAQHRIGDLLNPCEWEMSVPELNLGEGQQLSGARVTMKHGSRVEIRVDDPGRLLPAHERTGSGRELLVGVWTPRNTFLPAPVIAEDARGRTHAVVVPYGRSVPLTVTGRGFQVDDDSNKPIHRTDPPIQLRAEPETPRKVLRFRISSLAP